MEQLILALAIIVVASIVIMYACDSFDHASAYLGRDMKPGVKGATINAIASSLPELMTALFLLFLYHDQDGFSAGIATTAGSAVFNSVIIPMLCIFAVCFRGITKKVTTKTKSGRSRTKIVYEKIKNIQVGRGTVLRDGCFLLMAEAALIYFLGGTVMAWWMGGVLMLIYVLYFLTLMRGFSGAADDDDDDEEDDDDDGRKNWFVSLFTFDFNSLLFGGRPLTKFSAWTVLALSTTAVSIACWQLADAVILSSEALGVPPYFTAVIFAAAATSVPDTVLSVKDALRGDYDDAISNALGSNTFDITVALGLPLLLYGFIYGDVALSASDGTTSDVQVLRIVLFGVTTFILATFLISRSVTLRTAYILLGTYTAWIAFLVYNQYYL